MIPRKGTEPTLIEFALGTARRAVQVAATFVPFSFSGKPEIRAKADAVMQAIHEIESALADAGLMTWDTPVGRDAEYVLDRNLDIISTALAQGKAGAS